MKQLLFYAVALLGMVLIYSPASSATILLPPNQGCPLNENATLTIILNDADNDVTTLKDKLDREIADIERVAKDEGTTKFYVQSNNYNVGQQTYGQDKQYHLTGSITFKVEPSDKALGVMAILTKKGYSARANVNSFNNGFNCNNAVVPQPPITVP